MAGRKITIGTRGSQLALTQSNWVADQLRSAHPGLDVDLQIIKTKGDKILDVPLAKVGGKGLFVKEIEDALLDGRADIAVHSMKDVPTELPEGLFIACVPKREDVRDALISRTGAGLDDLPSGATVGTSSLRRRSQLLYARPDLNVVSLRGNLDTRIKKLETENLDAIVVAAAGLRRMGLADRASQFIPPDLMVPAIGQGALGIEARQDDSETLALLRILHHPPTAVCVAAERAFLATMEGGCQVPLAALCTLSDDRVNVAGLVADPDGVRYFRGQHQGAAENSAEIGRALAQDLLDQGGRAVLEEFYHQETV
jgi:hydroxymethylbilane synthase